MKMERQYRIEATCAPDNTRAGLWYVDITTYRDQPVAISADGFVLACVPVEMEYDDVLGLVDQTVIKRARSLSKDRLSIDLHKDSAGFIDGWTAPRVLARDIKDGAPPVFPNVMKIMEQCTRRGTVKPLFAMNPNLLVRAAKAIGWGAGPGLGEFGVMVHRDSVHGPLLIARGYQSGLPEPPFAVLMPMHTPQSAEEGRTQTKKAKAKAKAA